MFQPAANSSWSLRDPYASGKKQVPNIFGTKHRRCHLFFQIPTVFPDLRRFFHLPKNRPEVVSVRIPLFRLFPESIEDIGLRIKYLPD
ncbi:MAG: hypothetical protein JWN25_2483 [Verrucomicrobiales bacterium]|nr:hypothetical protein [Verrucomicrobiales bacterium]